jgi:hypothetical protein
VTTLWVGCGFFPSGDGGGEDETPGQVLMSGFRRTTRVSEQSFLCYILYIDQWGLHYSMCQTIANGAPDPRCPGQTRVMFKFRQPDDLFHTEDSEGAVAPRSVTDFTEQWVGGGFNERQA